jgi:hypothetical protein
VEAAPVYAGEGLELALRDAVESFLAPWRGRLGLAYHAGAPKEHWTRVKALTRRFANSWANEYDDLRPVADLVARLQESISRWLDNPAGWTSQPRTEEEQSAALANVRRNVFAALHDLAEDRLADDHRGDWVSAFAHAGTGSSYRRAGQIDRIYVEAAPPISSAMSTAGRAFLLALYGIVQAAVEAARGQFARRAA